MLNVWWERRANLAYLLVCRWLCIPVQRVHDSCLSWILWEVILNQNSDLSKLNYSREKKHKEFYQSNSQYFQGFFCPSGLVFVPLQFWFWYVKNIEVASEFSRAYPGPCGVREGGQTFGCSKAWARGHSQRLLSEPPRGLAHLSGRALSSSLCAQEEAAAHQQLALGTGWCHQRGLSTAQALTALLPLLSHFTPERNQKETSSRIWGKGVWKAFISEFTALDVFPLCNMALAVLVKPVWTFKILWFCYSSAQSLVITFRKLLRMVKPTAWDSTKAFEPNFSLYQLCRRDLGHFWWSWQTRFLNPDGVISQPLFSQAELQIRAQVQGMPVMMMGFCVS